MKEFIILLVVSGVGISLAAPQACCRNGAIMARKKPYRCGNENIISLHCTHALITVHNMVLDGDSVGSGYLPFSFHFAEDVSQYCVGKEYNNDSHPELGTSPIAYVCFTVAPERTDIEPSGILTLISAVFLILTVVFYGFASQMRDLQGLCYMCMCTSMALGYISIGLLQLNPGFKGNICAIGGFLVYTLMMATFFWMNVICINMYRTVIDANYLKTTERKQYAIYSGYAWGGTVLFLTVLLITNFVDGNHYKPGIGANNCWFSGRTETWIFFYGPIAILLSANVILFALSSFNLWKKNRRIEDNALNNLKFKFLLSLKLFLVMGISWIFEIISFAHGQSHIIWTILDTFNCLQGITTFLILVVFRKRAIKILIQKNCCLFITRPLSEKLSPHDDSDDESIIENESEIRLT